MILHHVLDASKYSSIIVVRYADTDVFVGLVSHAQEREIANAGCMGASD